MFYQYQLLKKKGQFGVVWLAAHYPSKLTKHDILTFDLESKCKEILEFITNGKFDKPRLSIKLSSYLMYGLAVIFKRKTEYYFNDLDYVKALFKRPVVTLPATTAGAVETAKTPRKGGRKINANKSAIEVKENLPEDFMMIDMTFTMPKELMLETTIPQERLRDITLPEVEIEQYELMHPIPTDQTEMEFLPMPSQYFFEEEKEGAELEKRLGEKRVPFSEIDLNRLEQQQRMRGGPQEDTFRAMESALKLPHPPLHEEAAAEITTLPTEAPPPPPQLFEISEVIPPPALVEETPAPGIGKKTTEPEPAERMIIEEEAAAAAERRPLLEITRLPKRVKKNIIVDKVTKISDEDMRKQVKLTPKPSIKLPIKSHGGMIEKMDLDLFKLTSKELREPRFMALPKNLRGLNVYNRLVAYSCQTRTNVKEKFEPSLSKTESEERLMAESIQAEREEDISRRRRARSSILGPSVLDRLSIQEEISKGGVIEQPSAIQQPPSEIQYPEQFEFETLPFQPPSPRPHEIPAITRIEEETQAQIAEEEEEERRELNKNEEFLMDQIKDGKNYFHEIAVPGITKRKNAVSLFASALSLCKANKIKVTQDQMYGPIELELKA